MHRCSGLFHWPSCPSRCDRQRRRLPVLRQRPGRSVQSPTEDRDGRFQAQQLASLDFIYWFAFWACARISLALAGPVLLGFSRFDSPPCASSPPPPPRTPPPPPPTSPVALAPPFDPAFLLASFNVLLLLPLGARSGRVLGSPHCCFVDLLSTDVSVCDLPACFAGERRLGLCRTHPGFARIAATTHTCRLARRSQCSASRPWEHGGGEGPGQSRLERVPCWHGLVGNCPENCEELAFAVRSVRVRGKGC